MTRAELIRRLVDTIDTVRRPHPLRVAVDGPDAAGKTTLADELAPAVRARGRQVIRASIDDFGRPRAERYRRGADSPTGYYLDSFDHQALCAHLLDPLGPGGRGWYRRAVFDIRTDTPLPAPTERAAADAVVLVDGVFLLRPELRDRWDLRVFVSVGEAEVLRRALARDAALFGSAERTEQRYRTRYLPAQRRYLAEARPAQVAEVVVGNDDVTRPVLVVRSGR